MVTATPARPDLRVRARAARQRPGAARAPPSRDLSERPPPAIGPYRCAGVRPGRALGAPPRPRLRPAGPAGRERRRGDHRALRHRRPSRPRPSPTGTSLDLMQELPPTAPAARDPIQVRRPLRGARPGRRRSSSRSTRRVAAVRRPQGPPGSEPRGRRARRSSASTPAASSRAATCCPPSVPGLPQARALPVRGAQRAARPGPGARSSWRRPARRARASPSSSTRRSPRPRRRATSSRR